MNKKKNYYKIIQSVKICREILYRNILICLECAEIGIGALVTREITDSDTFAGIPLKEAIKIVIDYKKR